MPRRLVPAAALLLAGCASPPAAVPAPALPVGAIVEASPAGPAGMAPASGNPLQTEGFLGPDLLQGEAYASPVAPPMAQTNRGIRVAIDATASRAAYATPDGVFVGPVGGAARKVAEAGGEARDLRWTPDGAAVLLVERAATPACTTTAAGLTCVSTPADDVARLVRLGTDGARTVLAADVGALDGLVVTDDAAWFRGGLAGRGGIHRVPLAGGAAETRVPDDGAAVGSFALSPDGARLAWVAGDVVRMAPAAGGEPEDLGTLAGPDFRGPFWDAGSRAVRFVAAGRFGAVPVAAFPLDGPAEGFTLPMPAGAKTIGAIANAPDGRFLVAQAGPVPGGGGGTAVFRLDLEARAFTPLAPDGRLVHWLGAGPGYLAVVGRSWGQRFYVVRPA